MCACMCACVCECTHGHVDRMNLKYALTCPHTIPMETGHVQLQRIKDLPTLTCPKPCSPIPWGLDKFSSKGSKTYLSASHPHWDRTSSAPKDQRLTCPHAIPMPHSPIPWDRTGQVQLQRIKDLPTLTCPMPASPSHGDRTGQVKLQRIKDVPVHMPSPWRQDRFSSKGSKTYLLLPVPCLLPHPMGIEQDRFSSKGSKTYLSTCHPHASLSHPMWTGQVQLQRIKDLPVHMPSPCLDLPSHGTEQDRFSSKESKTYLSTRHSHAPLSHPMGAGQVQLQSVGASILQVKWENVAVNILYCLILKTT